MNKLIIAIMIILPFKIFGQVAYIKKIERFHKEYIYDFNNSLQTYRLSEIINDTSVKLFEFNGSQINQFPTPDDIHIKLESRAHLDSIKVVESKSNFMNTIEYWSDNSIVEIKNYRKNDSTTISYISFDADGGFVESGYKEKYRDGENTIESSYTNSSRSVLRYKRIEIPVYKTFIGKQILLICITRESVDTIRIVKNWIRKIERKFSYNSETKKWFKTEFTKNKRRREITTTFKYDDNNKLDQSITTKVLFNKQGLPIYEIIRNNKTKLIMEKSNFTYEYYK